MGRQQNLPRKVGEIHGTPTYNFYMLGDHMGVIPFPLPKERALVLLRETAQDTGKVLTPDPPEAWGEWQRTVSHLQIMQCLQEGELIGGPTLDRLNNWRCVLRRFSVGVQVEVTASLYKQNDEWWVVVTEVKTT